MVDNCSHTARIGSRKWYPRFMAVLDEQVFVDVDDNVPVNPETVDAFVNSPVHKALSVCSEMRPSVDISIGGDDSSEGVGIGGARVEFKSTVVA